MVGLAAKRSGESPTSARVEDLMLFGRPDPDIPLDGAKEPLKAEGGAIEAEDGRRAAILRGR